MDKIFSPIKERIIQFIDYKNITKESFFQATGMSRSNFSGSNAGSEVGGEKIVKILLTYPEINPYWLLLGQGSMTITGNGGHTQIGKTNTITRSPINNVNGTTESEELGRLRKENEQLRQENSAVKEELLKAKDEIINLLKNKN